MAHFDTARPANGYAPAGISLVTEIYVAILRIGTAIVDWNNDRATRKLLEKLSDHELNDIGLVRGDIDRL